MGTLVQRKFIDMEKIKILCLGNSSTDTVIRSNQVAQQYATECNGLLTEQDNNIQPGCYYTDIGTVGIDYLRSICKSFDLIFNVHPCFPLKVGGSVILQLGRKRSPDCKKQT